MGAENIHLESNRGILIIDDQWQGPASYIIQDGAEFQHIAALLKLWCAPFDILRLDQEPMTLNRFLDMEGNPAYGCIIWDADTSQLPREIDYTVLRNAVVEFGISLIALSDRIQEPELQNLSGLEYIGSAHTTKTIRVSKNHFVARPFLDKPFRAKCDELYNIFSFWLYPSLLPVDDSHLIDADNFRHAVVRQTNFPGLGMVPPLINPASLMAWCVAISNKRGHKCFFNAIESVSFSLFQQKNPPANDKGRRRNPCGARHPNSHPIEFYIHRLVVVN